MDIEQLLARDESATLDFKGKWYQLDSTDTKTRTRQKGELIKDVLSLANGNTNVAGETAYLVIGVSDERGEDGKREIVGVENPERMTRERILDIVNAVASPHLADIECNVVSAEQKNVVVITIYPSPHVHETTRKLQTPKRDFDEYTVFVRHGSGIRTASTKERIALAEIKKFRFEESRNVHPGRFGMGLGAAMGAMLIPPMAERIHGKKEGYFAGLLAGPIVGGFLGGILGSTFQDVRSIKSMWPRLSTQYRVFGVALSIGIPTLSVYLLKKFAPK